jgi:hypothetical protein
LDGGTSNAIIVGPAPKRCRCGEGVPMLAAVVAASWARAENADAAKAAPPARAIRRRYRRRNANMADITGDK